MHKLQNSVKNEIFSKFSVNDFVEFVLKCKWNLIMTASKSGENSVGVASNENSNSDANENEEESKATDCSGYESSKKVLILKSPMGAKSAQYNWPLKKGKGSLRRSEDKEDEAGEIIETIR